MNARGRWRGRSSVARNSAKQNLHLNHEELLERKLGFDLYTEGDKKLGWLLTFSPSSWEDQETNKMYSCVDLYFVSQDGSTFKVKHKFPPYFYAATKVGVLLVQSYFKMEFLNYKRTHFYSVATLQHKMEFEIEAYLKRRYEGEIADIVIVEKEDLDLKNHLSGLRRSYLKLSFDTVQQLMRVKNDLMHVAERNKSKLEASEAFETIFIGESKERSQDLLDCIIDLREYDVPYHVRYAIDNDVRCGQWYDISVSSDGILLEKRADLLQRAEVHVCAFDIETTKLPLKFPDAEHDLIMMISYMIDGQGFLIINRECVGEDIEDLEYTPKPEFEGCFKVKNVKNEKELLKTWKLVSSVTTIKGNVVPNFRVILTVLLGSNVTVTFLKEAKVLRHNILSLNFTHISSIHQAVTKAKLGYNPLEVNPEDMVRFAVEQPQMMASYSVSDAVATYYLYMTYVHPFIFSLATIIPMPPDEVLRKGSGTLCEMLLMVQAHKANVICPNKHQSDSEKFYKNRLLECETYIGGHVECLESGVFRSDIPIKFQFDPSAYEVHLQLYLLM
ncbi:hypothetical protein ZIOFF_075134 [Zingiber officinale]|uniref:DNA polymerase epsilon catalytic subunit n=1 Tax=Zingiber officinale TaxID=94328 RepID=A0A8J5EMZ7_ZINOF|nr:hypothetical protein ZIOFF_075134 [Zingiber officinale]